jgi:hypothetical protein
MACIYMPHPAGAHDLYVLFKVSSLPMCASCCCIIVGRWSHVHAVACMAWLQARCSWALVWKVSELSSYLKWLSLASIQVCDC